MDFKEVIFKYIELGDKDYFLIHQNKLGMTKGEYRLLDTKNPEDIPVYTANKKEVAYFPLLKHKAPFLATREHPLVSFGDDGDGSAGTNFIYHERAFYNNTSRKVLEIKNTFIDAKYIMYSLRNMKHQYGFNYKFKCNEDNLAQVSIPIPIKHDGTYDLEIQQTIAKRYERIATFKEQMSEYLDRLKKITVKIDKQEKIEFKNVYLDDKNLFILNIGNRITKKELLSKKTGQFPIYSANVYNPFAYIDELFITDFSSDFIIWGIDGDWQTRYIPKEKPFIPTDHCGYLQCNNTDISLKYLSYIIYNIGLEHGFSRTYRSSLENMKNLVVQIPIKSDGSFDLETQQAIAKRYERIQIIQSNAIEKLSDILKTNVTII